MPRHQTSAPATTRLPSPPEHYERHFVPAIGEPVARDLLERAALRAGERVLDVACGTGVVARLAAAEVGATGAVAGLDVNAGMLAVARAVTPPGVAIEWYEASAEDMPLADGTFDVVLCQMGLQFVQDRLAAVRELHRVLAPGGRLLLNVPGPTPPPMAVLASALATHIGPQAAAFVHAVFSLHDPGAVLDLLRAGGFHDTVIDQPTKRLVVPRDFPWQYLHSTPVAPLVAAAAEDVRGALEREIATGWQQFVRDDAVVLEVGMLTAIARKAG